MSGFLELFSQYDVLGAFLVNIELTLWSALFSLILGVILVVMRISPISSLRAVAGAYVELFKNLPLTIIMAAIMGSNITNVALILGLFSWPSLARVTKNSTLKIKEMQYIEAASCLGISKTSILFKHVLLNASGPVFVNLTLVMASAVLSEASLSFLGLGDPTTWSWGTILKRAWGANAVITNPNPWWWWLMPSLCIVVYVVCFNLFGTALNDTLNPKGR